MSTQNDGRLGTGLFQTKLTKSSPLLSAPALELLLLLDGLGLVGRDLFRSLFFLGGFRSVWAIRLGFGVLSFGVRVALGVTDFTDFSLGVFGVFGLSPDFLRFFVFFNLLSSSRI